MSAQAGYDKDEWSRYETRRRAWNEYTAINPYIYTGLLIESLLKREPRRILDVACGNGDMLAGLGAVYEAAALVGVDGSIDALAKAELLTPQASFILQGIDDLSLFHRDYDLITCLFSLYHADNPMGAVDRMVEHLAPGGLLVTATISDRSMPEIWGQFGYNVLSMKTGMESYQAIDMHDRVDGVDRVAFTTLDTKVMFPDKVDVFDFIASTLTRSSIARYVDEYTPLEATAKFAFAAYRKAR